MLPFKLTSVPVLTLRYCAPKNKKCVEVCLMILITKVYYFYNHHSLIATYNED